MLPMLAVSDVVMSVEWLPLPLLSCSGRVLICEELEQRRSYLSPRKCCNDEHPVAVGEGT